MVPSAMLAVHEQVKHRAQKQQQVRQSAEEMRPVLGQQKEKWDAEKDGKHPPRLRPEPGVGLEFFMSSHIASLDLRSNDLFFEFTPLWQELQSLAALLLPLRW